MKLTREDIVMMLRTFLFALLAAYIPPAEAGKIKWFNLHTESYERVLLCLRVVDAVAIAATRATRPGDDKTGLALFLAQQDSCQRLNIFVAFTRLVYRFYDEEGNFHSVYEAVVRGMVVYIPLTNQDHRRA